MVTVTVITPLKVLEAFAPPVPENVLPPWALRLALPNRPARKLALVVENWVVELRLVFAPEDFVALMFS